MRIHYLHAIRDIAPFTLAHCSSIDLIELARVIFKASTLFFPIISSLSRLFTPKFLYLTL